MSWDDGNLLVSWRSVLVTAVLLASGSWLLQRRHRQNQLALTFAAKHGCLPPKIWNSTWPLGLDMLVKALQFARTEQILQFFVQVVRENGLTFEQRLLGATGIDTVDPRNIEAVLSANFTGTSQ